MKLKAYAVLLAVSACGLCSCNNGSSPPEAPAAPPPGSSESPASPTDPSRNRNSQAEEPPTSPQAAEGNGAAEGSSNQQAQPAGQATPGGGHTTPSAPSNEWTNKTMQKLVQSRCATSGCHDGGRPPNLKNINEAGMKALRAALTQVKQGTMPKGGRLSPSELATFENFFK